MATKLQVHPTVHPRPTLSELPLEAPLLPSDTAAMEDKLMRGVLFRHEARPTVRRAD